MLSKRLFLLLISYETRRFNGRILLGFKLLNRLCILFLLDVLEVVHGWFVRRHYLTFGVIDGGKCCAKKIFIFTTNKDLEIAIEKYLEDFVPVCTGSDDENELICSVIGS